MEGPTCVTVSQTQRYSKALRRVSRVAASLSDQVAPKMIIWLAVVLAQRNLEGNVDEAEVFLCVYYTEILEMMGNQYCLR